MPAHPLHRNLRALLRAVSRALWRALFRAVSPLRFAVLAGVLGACGPEVPTPGAPDVGTELQRPALSGALVGDDCLIIVLDALHASWLGCYGGDPRTSPHIDALAARGVRFSRAWSQTSWTLPSTVSLMTGLYQETHGVNQPDELLTDAADTLAEAFARAGYTTLAFTQNPYASGAFGLAQGFQSMELLPATDTGRQPGEKATDERLADAVLAALAARGSGPPRFVYAHFRRPHMPYDPPPEQRAVFCDPAYAGSVTGTEEDRTRNNERDFYLRGNDLAHLRNLYRANIRAADEHVGRILAGIDLQHTFVLVLADHGDELNEHKRLGHNFTSYEELVNIPLIAAHAALAGGRTVDTPVMSIDVFSTLADLFHLDADPSALQGRSLAPELAGRAGPAREVVFTSSRQVVHQMLAATDGRLKYMVIPDVQREELYDLLADPAEQQNLISLQPEETRRLRRLLVEWQNRQQPRGLDATIDPDEHVSGMLEELGYIGNGDDDGR